MGLIIGQAKECQALGSVTEEVINNQNPPQALKPEP